MSDEHEAFIKTPRQLIVVVILAFVVPITVMMLLARYMNTSVREGAGADTMTAQSVEARIRPVAHFQLVDASVPRKAASGEEVYKTQCSACHAAGVAGAPKFGDKTAWADRIKTGLESLAHSALKGKGAMPTQGGGQFDDNEITAAVVYMANAGGADFEAPKAAEATTTAQADSAGAAAPATAPPVPAAPATPAPVPARVASTPAPAPEPPPVASAAAAAGATGPAAASAAPAPTADLAAGKKIFDTTCFVCHATGVAGAPKYGDKAAWDPFLKTGIDTMVKNAITGIGAMPPRGGNANLSDADMHAAVEYMAAAASPPGTTAAAPAAAAPAATAPAPAPAPAVAPTPAPAAAPATAPAPPSAANAASVAAPAASAADLAAGKKTYDTTCFVCHATGVAGAPKYGDKAAWDPFLKTGIDTMVKNAITGIGAMPPRGGNANLSDADMHAAVEYMAAAAK